MTHQAGVLAGFAFVFGAVVGSFLNACIHRLPRGIRLDQPRRSFCPHCQATIPWYHNLPIVSWLWLRGRCAKCGAPISPRYILVEILTGVVFFALWLKFGLPLAPAYMVFAALLIAATFIDFEHYIIPDEITLGGAAAGVIASAILPGLMDADSHWQGALFSLVAGALGAAALWVIVEAGKMAFGRKRIELDPAEEFHFEPDPENPRLVIGDETHPWDEIFSRPSDVLVLECERAILDGAPAVEPTVRVYYNRVVVAGRETPIESVRELAGVLRAVVIPREAMGLGDVKFLACIGAFLGWQAIIFTIVTSSVIGAIVGGGMLLVSRGQVGGKIPYGPYLALGAALWLVCGPEMVNWYLHLIQPALP